MAIVAPMSGVPYTLQNAATTGNGDVVCPPPSFRNHTITISTPNSVTAGAIQVETADDPNYTGTWVAQGAAISTVGTSGANQVDKELTGVFTAIRARISTTISGGAAPSVTVKYMGAKSY